jgi:hypothetical protein
MVEARSAKILENGGKSPPPFFRMFTVRSTDHGTDYTVRTTQLTVQHRIHSTHCTVQGHITTQGIEYSLSLSPSPSLALLLSLSLSLSVSLSLLSFLKLEALELQFGSGVAEPFFCVVSMWDLTRARKMSEVRRAFF